MAKIAVRIADKTGAKTEALGPQADPNSVPVLVATAPRTRRAARLRTATSLRKARAR